MYDPRHGTILHSMLHFASVILWYILKGLLALIVVVVGGFTLVVAAAVIIGPLFEERNQVKGAKSPINPYANDPE